MTATTEPAVLVSADGLAGRITLNQPDTLNALTLEMVRLIESALDRFQEDETIATVIIDGAGGRALCAGGDIRSIYQATKAGDPSPSMFWAEEYRLNARLAYYPKPIVALMDGIVMGGGVGISAHVSHRVVTERSVVAMPEVGIGFAPDVGGTWLLSRAPGELGTHIALTAGRLKAGDAILCSLADHFVASTAVPTLIKGLSLNHPADVIPRLAGDVPSADLEEARPWIDACYSADSVEEIIGRLHNEAGPAANASDEILRNSPTSLVVTLRALRTARSLPTLARCLEMEYRISTAFLETSDFLEGVRAAIIDKDRSPRWEPARLDDVGDIERFFRPRANDLRLNEREPAL